MVIYLAISALLPHSKVLPGLPESSGLLSHGWAWPKWDSSRRLEGGERSGLFFSTPSRSGLCFLVMCVSSITMALLGQPLSIAKLSILSIAKEGLCLPCSFVSLGAGDVSLWLISVSSLSISHFINPSHIFANVLLVLLSHLSTSLCLLRLYYRRTLYNIGEKWRTIRKVEFCTDIFRIFFFFCICSDGVRAAEKDYLR